MPSGLNSALKRLIDRTIGRDPLCGSANEATRETWVRGALAALPAGLRILDAGAGELRYAPACEHLDYVSQDFGGYDGEGDGSGLQTGAWDQSRIDILSDITKIPEPDASFDAVLCVEVLEHVPDPVGAIWEFARLIRDGGTLLLTAPFCSLTHFAPHHYQTGFNRYFYEHWLGEAEFDVVELTPNGNFFEYMAQETRRIKSVATRYAPTDQPSRLRTWTRTIAERLMLIWLDRLSRRDRGSAELLAFGYHVRAIRRPRVAHRP